MISIADRLQRAMREGNLTMADLARWFGRPHPTVRGWTNGTKVGAAALDHAWIIAMLVKLEKLIRSKKELPMPRLSPKQRIAYLDTVRKRSIGGK